MIWLLIPMIGHALPGIGAGAPRPNFLVILIDDMGWADAQCLGSKFYHTPHLDALAATSMRFTQAYASAAVCSPTRAALLTGKCPARLHITDWIPGEPTPKNSRFLLPKWQQHLPLEETTSAEILHSLGYRTALIGKWHLGAAAYYPEHHGFDVNVGGCEIGHPASYFWPYGKAGASHRVPGLSEQGGANGEYLTDRLTDEALRFIEAQRDRPFLLELAHYAVHAPLMAKEQNVQSFQASLGANGQSNATYAAMIQSVDESVGRVLKKLDELHLREKTVVIFTSDNGGAVHFGQPPATSNAPLRMGKGYPYEGGLRVPLLIRAPELTRAGSVCPTPVITHDLFPTLLELAGTNQTRSEIDGVSLVPLLKGAPALPSRALFWHYPHYWNGGKVSPFSVARVGDWKLIRFYESGKEELYNLADDPSESKDRAGSNPVRRLELSQQLDSWLRNVGAQMPVAKLQ